MEILVFLMPISDGCKEQFSSALRPLSLLIAKLPMWTPC